MIIMPGIRVMVGERCSSQASAVCCGDAPMRAATRSSTSDCSGENPPSGKNGVKEMPSAAHRATSASSCRLARL
jgi:hypothetical protein